MDRQWRPAILPIQFHGNVNVNACPACLIPHFPFCPHPPPPPSYYPPQPPFSSRPTNPNWDPRPPPPPPYHHPNPNADGDRSFKRPRVDDLNLWEEDERRLKLIRDHGRVALPNPNPNPNNHHPQFYGATTATQQGCSSSHVNAAYRDDSENSRFFRGQAPLPSSPPPPLPSEPPLNHFKPPSLFPLHSAPLPPPSSYSQLPEPHHPYFHTKTLSEYSPAYSHEERSKQYLGDPQPFSLKQLPAEKPNLVDVSHLFRHPHRTSRPDHFVIIFRGLPGLLCAAGLSIIDCVS